MFVGPHLINEEESYKYLGVYFSKYLSVKENIKEASDKLKGTLVSLVNSGIVHENAYILYHARKYTDVLYCQKLSMLAKTGVN